MEARRCIYCLAEKPDDQFNDEHVLPEALGTYDPTPRLRCVCENCNARLGRDVVSPFLRRSGEGLMRYRFGQRPLDLTASEKRRLARVDCKRLQFEPVLPFLFNKLKGLHFFGFDTDHGIARSLPQIGLWPTSLELPDFFTIEELEQGRLDLTTYVCEHESPALLVCETDDDEQRLVALARRLGAVIARVERVKLPDRFRGTLTGKLGPQELRFPAYVAFNVAAFYLGASTVIDDCFNDIRTFVNGRSTRTALSFVGLNANGPLFFDRDRRATIKCHLVAIGWENQERDLVAQVSLYNMFHYRVLIIRDHRGIWRPDWQIGRVFNWESGEILELRPLPANLVQ